MADEQRPSGPPGGKRRRPPSTIDLKATEVPPESVQPTEHADPLQEPAPAEGQPAVAGAAAEPTGDPSGEPSPSASDATTKAVEQSEERPDASAINGSVSAPREGWAGRMNGRLIAAAVAGVAAILVLFLAVWSLGAFGSRDDQEARLAALEKQVRDLSAKPVSSGLDPRALADLEARVSKAEQAAAASPPAQPDQALASRIAALESTMRPLAEAGQRADAANAAAREAKSRADAAFDMAQKNSVQPAAEAADRKDIEVLAARLATLEQAAKSVDDKIARAVRGSEADRAGRLAFVATSLRSAVERGDPFAQELAAAKSLAPDGSVLAPLEPFATTGVPRAAMLARELSQLSGPILSAAGTTPRDGGILDRLQQNAERLVRIRPISEAPGEDPAAIVARAEAKASRGDIAGALSDLSQLPEPARAPAQAWVKKAEAQVAALAVARKLADNAIGALGKAPP